MSYTSQRNEIVAIGRLLFDKGLTSGTGGNLSIRVKDGLLITPSGFSLGFMEKENLIVLDDRGNKIEGYSEPSSERLMHISVYENRADIKACCHAHPPYATAFSLTNQKLRTDIHPEAVVTLGEIAYTEYAPPGTDAVPKALENYLKKHNVFILKNHGVLTLGRDMREAYYRMETVEHLAKITYIAKRAGKIDFLEKKEVERLRKIRHDSSEENS
jgi:L-fuculose-phosphate aldolase